jgi:hypothetical protein
MTSRGFKDFFSRTRDNDVKIVINDVQVPVAALTYDPSSDNYLILPVEDEYYRIALEPDLDVYVRRDWKVAHDNGRTCTRCDRAIRMGEAYLPHDDSHVHVHCPKSVS